MALRIYYSDRIEDLAADLKGRLLAERAKVDSFEFSQVVVPNTNIAKWLQIRVFADSPSLCMGVEFPFIEQRLLGLLRESVGGERRLQLLPMNAYANAIMSILLKDNDDKLAPFRRYVAEGNGGPLKIDTRGKARMAWQLSVKLADLMDKYEVHREEIVKEWLDEGRAAAIKEPTEIAEAALAEWGQPLPAPAFRKGEQGVGTRCGASDLRFRALDAFVASGEDPPLAGEDERCRCLSQQRLPRILGRCGDGQRKEDAAAALCDKGRRHGCRWSRKRTPPQMGRRRARDVAPPSRSRGGEREQREPH